MKRRSPLRVALISTLTAISALGTLSTNQAYALDNVVEKLTSPQIHCGQLPQLDLFNGVVHALSAPQTTAEHLTLRREDWRLELLMHFTAGQNEIPDNCFHKLEVLNEATKAGRSGPILIRSSTQVEGSPELDLALASQRLEAVEKFLRDNRLARKAFVLELHPSTSNPLIGDAVSLPNVVEVYSSPAN